MNKTFQKLSKIDVGENVEKKNGLSYLSWAWAWRTFCENVENPNYTVYETADGINYFNDGRTAWVKTGVSVGDYELIEYLPVMDYRNKSIPLEKITSFDVNKTIQRSLTKAIARHGLGLYIYAGEDLPEATGEQVARDNVKKIKELDTSARVTNVVNYKDEITKLMASNGVSGDDVLSCVNYLTDKGLDLRNDPKAVFTELKDALISGIKEFKEAQQNIA